VVVEQWLVVHIIIVLFSAYPPSHPPAPWFVVSTWVCRGGGGSFQCCCLFRPPPCLLVGRIPWWCPIVCCCSPVPPPASCFINPMVVSASLLLFLSPDPAPLIRQSSHGRSGVVDALLPSSSGQCHVPSCIPCTHSHKPNGWWSRCLRPHCFFFHWKGNSHSPSPPRPEPTH